MKTPQKESDRLPSVPHRNFSDHSAIWADFGPEILFLGELSSTINQSARKLKSSNPQHVKNYMDALINNLTANNII
eukprot:1326926-Ditylum_brightwellii.AAC.1